MQPGLRRGLHTAVLLHSPFLLKHTSPALFLSVILMLTTTTATTASRQDLNALCADQMEPAGQQQPRQQQQREQRSTHPDQNLSGSEGIIDHEQPQQRRREGVGQ